MLCCGIVMITKKKECINSSSDIKSSESLDFSIADNAMENFYVECRSWIFSENVRKACINVCIGVIAGLITILFTFIVFIKLYGSNSKQLQAFTKNYISSVFNSKDATVQSSELTFHDGSICIQLKDVKTDRFVSNEINIKPAILKSIFHKKLIADDIEISGANIDLAISSRTNNIFLKNYFNIANKAKYIPISLLPRTNNGQCSYQLKDATITIRRNYEKFILNKFSGSFDKDLKLHDAQFSTDIADKNHTFKILNINNKYEITFNDVVTSDIQKFFIEKKLNSVFPAVESLQNCVIPISGAIICDRNLTNCTFYIDGSSGALSRNFTSIIGGRYKHVDRIHLSGHFSPSQISLDKATISKGEANINATGLAFKNGQYSMDGTIEMRNVNKQDLLILPKPVIDSCFVLFNDKLPSFLLSSLKMDISGDASTGKDFHISHGKFEMKDGAIPLANKMMTNVMASGEILHGKTTLRIKSADLDNMRLSGGEINIMNHGRDWNGIINTTISSKEFIENLNIFKRLSLPFDQFVINDNVKCSLCIVSNDSDHSRGFSIVSGSGTIESGDGNLCVMWDNNIASIKGTAMTLKGKHVNVNITLDIKNNSGDKQIMIDSDHNVLATISETLSNAINGEYKLDIKEKWSGAKGTYIFDVDLKNASLCLPALGHVKMKNEPGRIYAVADVTNGTLLDFNSISIETKDKKIRGNLRFDRAQDRIISCHFSDISQKKQNDFINIKTIDKNKIKINIAGSHLDIPSMLSMVTSMNDTQEIEISTRIAEAKISDTNIVRDLRGRINLRNGNIIGGAGYCVLSDGSTVILESLKVDGANVIKIDSANAGQLLKEFGISDAISGGKIKLIVTSDHSIADSDKIHAINCELSDVLLTNSDNILKLASLSGIAYNKEKPIGFNGIVCSITINGNKVEVKDGRAIGPSMCLSFNGIYDIADDQLKLNGIVTPVNQFSQNGWHIYSPYALTGTLSNPEVEVSPIRSTDKDILKDVFGIHAFANNQQYTDNIVRHAPMDTYHPTTMVKPIVINNSSNVDPVKHETNTLKDVDEIVIKQPVDLEKTSQRQKKPVQVKRKRSKTYGITVTRGI